MGTNGYQQIFRKPEKVLWGNTLCDTLSSHPGEPSNTTSCFKLQKTEKSSSMIRLPAHLLNFENSLLPYYNNKLVLTEIKQQFSKLLLKTTRWNFSLFWKDAEIFSAHPGILKEILKMYCLAALMLLAIGDIGTYWSHVAIAFGVLPRQTKIQHEAGMASVWCIAHCKIRLKI